MKKDTIKIIDLHKVSPTGGNLEGALEVLVFKTNLTNRKCINDIEISLDIHPHIRKWNVDLHDCDNILRIEANNLSGKEVENILLSAGYYCEELE